MVSSSFARRPRGSARLAPFRDCQSPPEATSSAKLIFLGPPFASSSAGARPTAAGETVPSVERATAGDDAVFAVETGRAIPAERVSSRLEPPPAAAGAALVEALNDAGRNDANTSFIAGAERICDRVGWLASLPILCVFFDVYVTL